jgi:excisionase family DNA binding protein
VDTDLLRQLGLDADVIAVVSRPREHDPSAPNDLAMRKWYSVREVAAMLGYGLSKTKMLVATRQIRSIKDGGSRRILPAWVDEYIARKTAEALKEAS